MRHAFRLAGILGLVGLLPFEAIPSRAGQHVDFAMGSGAYVAGVLEQTATASATFISGSAWNDMQQSQTLVCITVASGDRTDAGCTLTPKGSGSVDVPLSSGALNFSVPSATFAGGTLACTVGLSGYGSYYEADGGETSYSAERLDFQVSRVAQVARDALVQGSCLSSTLGGGALQPESSGVLFNGAQATVSSQGCPGEPHVYCAFSP